MKKEFVDYLRSIGINEPIQARIQSIIDKINIVLPNLDIKDMAVTEYVDKEGQRHYDDIRFYSGNIGVLSVDFLTSDDIIISILGGIKFRGVRINSKDYDFVKATTNSRIRVIGKLLSTEAAMDIRGTGENCDHIMKIVNKYVLPRLLGR
jgi:hypothetical protein